MKHLIHSMIWPALLLTMAACSERTASKAEAEIDANEPIEIVGVASAVLTERDLRRQSLAALEGDTAAAINVMVHYQEAEHDHRNAEYWAQIAAENGDVYGIFHYTDMLLDISSRDRCYRAQFWLKRAIGIDGRKEEQWISSLESRLAQQCLGLLPLQ